MTKTLADVPEAMLVSSTLIAFAVAYTIWRLWELWDIAHAKPAESAPRVVAEELPTTAPMVWPCFADWPDEGDAQAAELLANLPVQTQRTYDEPAHIAAA